MVNVWFPLVEEDVEDRVSLRMVPRRRVRTA